MTIEGAGSIQSGNWLVWNVRHKYSLDSWKMSFTLVRNAMGPAATGSALASSPAPRPDWQRRRRCDRDRRPRTRGSARAAAHPLLRQVPRHRLRRRRVNDADQGQGARRCSARPQPAGACLASPTPGPGRLRVPARDRKRRLDRVRGRRRVVPHLGRRLLARGRVPGRRRRRRQGDHHRPPRTRSKLDDDQGTITLSDPNGNTVTLDSSGITLANGQSDGRGQQLERVGQRRRAGGAVMTPRPAGLRVPVPDRHRHRSRPRRPATPLMSTR